MVSRLALLVVLIVVAACGSKGPAALAELTKADGPVDRQAGKADADWKSAAVGTSFFLGDAARTADGGAQLSLAGGAAKIAMEPRTILRFGRGKGDASKIAVETGAIDLTGSGNYALDIGNVNLKNNTSVRITATGKGQSEIELIVGDAEITSTSGQTIDLTVGKPIDLALDMPAVAVDAGVADAPPADAAEPPDAAPIASGDITAEITGKKAEILEPGTTTWKPLPAGMNPLQKGMKLRLGAATTAKVTAGGGTMELGAGARIEITKDGLISLEVGNATTTVPEGTTAKFAIPGGAVAVSGTKDAPGSARIELGKEAKVTVLKGTAKLTGGPGAELEMNRGESASIAKSGVIHPLEAIPQFYDFIVTVGETLSVHDPRGSTAVKFAFGGKCPNGGVVELDKNGGFRTPKVSSGKDGANFMVQGGSWAYRLRCSSGGGEGNAVASGRIAVSRDDGRRALPKLPPTNDIDADGRTWRISYQSVIPNLRVLYKGVGGSAFKLHLASGGKEETFEGGAKINVPGKGLHEGTYTYWFDHDGVKDTKVSTLKIDFDQTAPQVYIESPINGKPWAGDIDVRGAILPGWTASVDSITIPIDGQRRFAAKVAPPSGANALAIKLSHPQRGVHYYLRRPK